MVFNFGKKTIVKNVVKIGVWGPPKSGKTTYIALLERDSYSNYNSGEENAPRITYKDEFTRKFLSDYKKKLIDKKEFINPTDKVSDLNLEINYKGHLYQVHVPEAPGEDYTDPLNNPDLANKLSGYDAIIWLIDPLQVDNPKAEVTYRAMIDDWLSSLKLKCGIPLPHYMAFCLTKMDIESYSSYRAKPSKFFDEKLGIDVMALLNTYCHPNRILFFSTTSVGETIDPQNPQKLMKEPDPTNLFKPFAWILDNLS